MTTRLLVKTAIALLLITTAARAVPPYIEYIYPAGAQQGKTLTITLGGKSLDDASSVWVSGEGVTAKILKIEQPTDAQVREAKSRDEVAAQSAMVEFTIAPNAPESIRDVRIMTSEGLSNRFRFYVGVLPEILEKEPNGTPTSAQALPSLPIVVNGQIKNADHDRFKFKATKGQKLLIEVHARAIKPFMADAVPGWFQARIIVYDSKNKQVAAADDYYSNPDPVLMWEVPEDDEYQVEIWDAVARGRDDFVYRMKIGELPFITNVFPLGGQRSTGSTRTILSGWNLKAQGLRVKYAADAPDTTDIALKTPTGFTNKRPFEIGDLPEIIEKEPNHTANTLQQVPVPVTINGRIDPAGDVDIFTFNATANQTLVFNVMARRLGSPIDAKLRLTDGKGAPIKANDDYKDDRYSFLTHHADPRIEHTFTEAGTYRIYVEETQGKGGPEYGYRLHISEPQPDFDLYVTPDNLSVPAGGNVAIKLKAIRIDGYKGPIQLHVKGLPDGFNLEGAVIPEGKNDALLTLAAPEGSKPSVYRPTFTATATINGKLVTHPARQAEELMQAFFYYHTVAVDQGYLVVNPPNPFRLLLNRPDNDAVLEIPLNTDVEIPVKLIRNTTSSRQKGGGAIRVNIPTMYKGNLPTKGFITTVAVFEGAATDGIFKIRITNESLVGREGTLILEATHRGAKGKRTVSLAPAISYKIIPGPPAPTDGTSPSTPPPPLPEKPKNKTK